MDKNLLVENENGDLIFVNRPKTLHEFYFQTLSNIACDSEENEFVVCYDKNGVKKPKKSHQIKQLFSHAFRMACDSIQPFTSKQERVAICMFNCPEWMITFLAVTVCGRVSVCLNSMADGNEIWRTFCDSQSTVFVIDLPRLIRITNYLQQLTAKEYLFEALPFKRLILLAPTTPENESAVDLFLKLYRTVTNHSNDAVTISVQYWQHENDNNNTNGDNHSASDLCGNTLNLEKPNEDGHENAFICYTSGTSTAESKGVVLTHFQIMSQLNVSAYNSEIAAATAAAAALATTVARPCMLLGSPLFHMNGLGISFLFGLYLQRKVVVMEKWDALVALKLIEAEKITFFCGVPTMTNEVINHPRFDEFDLSSLASFGGGGSSMPPSQLMEMTRKLKNVNGNTNIWQGYGLTETAGGICRIAGKDYLSHPSSCGKPHIHTKVKIINPETGADDVTGNATSNAAMEEGEIVIKGPSVMKEYWRNETATADAFTKDGYFKTGDLGYIDADGYVYVTGRSKDIINRGGEKISAVAVEAAVYHHPDVFECAAIAIPDAHFGESVAIVVVLKPRSHSHSSHDQSHDSNPMTIDDIRLVCANRLSSFAMPTRLFIWTKGESLPKNAAGKINKRMIKI